MPESVDNCVRSLLGKDSFYPDEDQEERERIAWATCTKLNKEGKLEGSEIEFDEYEDGVFYWGAKWSTAYKNDLPDSAFLYVENGEKDEEGKTVPRSKRHFPVKDKEGNYDEAHVRNALGRIPQSNAPGLSAEKKSSLQSRCRSILSKHFGVKFESAFRFTNEVGLISVHASNKGDILVFDNAILCHEGGNANNDWIPTDEVQNLASTISGRPIDREHDQDEILGVFTAGRVIDDGGKKALSVDGLIWADRFPHDAENVSDGHAQLSVEALAQTASCTICNQVFAKASEYCDHIKDRKRIGAYRKLHGLKSKGGAVTLNPADSDAGFGYAEIRMVASHQEDNVVSSSSHKETDMDQEALEKSLAEMKSELESVQGEKDTLQEQLDKLTATKDELEKRVGELENELKSANERSDELLATVRREKLKATLDDQEWEKQRETIMQMSDDQFALMASLAVKNVPAREQVRFDVEGAATLSGNGEKAVEWEIN